MTITVSEKIITKRRWSCCSSGARQKKFFYHFIKKKEFNCELFTYFPIFGHFNFYFSRLEKESNCKRK